MTHPSPAKVPSGISCCGDLHWGAHICHLYETRKDLLDTLVPFFGAGLANNEQCLWVTAEPLSAAEAEAALAEGVPDLQTYLDRGQVRIVDHLDWYSRSGRFNADSLLQAWLDAEQEALARGYTGLRATGNVTFLKTSESWRDFDQYEARCSGTFAGRRIVALCSYHLGTSSGTDILEVVRHHQYALAQQDGESTMIENAAIKLAKQVLHKTNLELEQRVAQRTAELTHALATVEAQKRELETALCSRDATQLQPEAELTDARLLHGISATLIDEDVVQDLYQKLLNAAATVMRSDYASMQRFDPDRGELQLIAHLGFSGAAASCWEWIHPDSSSVCGMALRRRSRVLASDVDTCDFLQGTDHLATFRKEGIRSCQSTPLLSRNGTLVGMISTQWKQPCAPSERDLRLLDIVARQAADLIERNTAAQALRAQTKQLLEADRRKDEFLATLAHELRNPLAPIRTGMDVLKLGKPESMPRVLSIIERQLGHMVRLIDDLLDVSRISRGMVTLNRTPVELRRLVESAVETSQPLLDAAGHQLTVSLPAQPVWLDVDATRLDQVLSNVLNNAAKYTPRAGQVTVSAQLAADDVLIRVTDNGIGIPTPMLPRVFDLFMQVERTIERSQGGLGVGLSLARQLVELHGGSIRAESDGPGCGAAFTIRLPVIAAAPACIASPDAQAATSRAQGVRVLVVDDNVDAADTLALLLDQAGYTTRTVCEAPDALAAALDFRPDIAFLDLGMPKLSGFDLARQLREQPALSGLVIVAVSGWGSQDHRLRSRDAGIDHHLTKPALPADLDKILSQICSRPAAPAPVLG